MEQERFPADIPRTLRSHLAHFICLVNELRPVYHILENNNLSVGVLNGIVHRCARSDTMGAMGAAELPELTSDRKFLSDFLIRNCGNFLTHVSWPDGKLATAKRDESDNAASAALGGIREPMHTVLNYTQLGARAPRWAWSPHVHDTQKYGRMNIVHDVFGKEHELAKFRMFTQGQAEVSMGHPRWRRQDLYEWQHTLRDTMYYRPGVVWVNAEVWAAPAGKDTGFHYDYDPHVVLFQVVGSRRFHVLPPQSDALVWRPLVNPVSLPIDYGTRWADQKTQEGERIFDTQPGSVMQIPNGWPHKVVYRERSVGFRVASWTQCQALSMWLGQRLCLLSTMLGERRLCFDDEDYREHRAYKIGRAHV